MYAKRQVILKGNVYTLHVRRCRCRHHHVLNFSFFLPNTFFLSNSTKSEPKLDRPNERTKERTISGRAGGRMNCFNISNHIKCTHSCYRIPLLFGTYLDLYWLRLSSPSHYGVLIKSTVDASLVYLSYISISLNNEHTHAHTYKKESSNSE